MATGGMTTNEVRAEVNSLEANKKLAEEAPSKAVMKGVRTGERSSAGNEKESAFPRGTKKGI